MAKLSKAVTSAINAASSLNHREYMQFYTLVRREFVARNREKYSRECFKAGDVVKFRRDELAFSGYQHRNKHSPTGEVMFGIVHSANFQRSGRIQRYTILFVEGSAWKSPEKTTRGVKQVESVTDEEARVTRLLHNVRGGIDGIR